MQHGKHEHTDGWRAKVHNVIFESDTPSGKAFDVGLILLIVASILVVMVESVQEYGQRFGPALRVAEWVFTVAFTIEYVLRLACVKHPTRYARSFFGLVDLLAILPTYLSVLVPGAQALLVIRTLRILRVFRVLKLASYVRASETLVRAMYASRRKIEVFLFVVFTLVVIFGSLMYLVEGPEHGFTSIPRGLYWAIVTMTTVGYGDISPQTPLGQAIAAVIMIMGYGIIAVPTGIVTSELTQARNVNLTGKACPGCGATDHKLDAEYCRLCGDAM